MSHFLSVVDGIVDVIVEHIDHDIETEGDQNKKVIKDFFRDNYEEAVGLKYLSFRMSLKEIKNEELRGYTLGCVKAKMKEKLEDKMEKIIDIYDSYIMHIGNNQLYALEDSEESINQIGKHFAERTTGSPHHAFAIHLGINSLFLNHLMFFVKMTQMIDKLAYRVDVGWELHNRDPEEIEKQNERGRNPIGLINYFLIALGFFFTIAGLSDGEYFSAFVIGLTTFVNWYTSRLVDQVGWRRPWYPAHYWYIVTTSFLLIICIVSFAY